MKPIESIIADYLANYPALKAIHKGQACQGLADQNWKPPYQTVFLISNPSDMRRLKCPSPRVQINNFGTSYGQAQRIADLTFEALDGLSGTFQGVLIEQCIAGEVSEDYEPETGLFNASIDAIILYRSDN